MYRYFLLLFLVFLTTACEDNLGTAEPKQDKSVGNLDVATNLTKNEYLAQAKYLQKALEDTPYAALIKITSVEVIELPDSDETDDYAEQKLIYTAKVLETYRGSTSNKISYVMYIEKGDETEHSEDPFIITLCQSKQGLFWPGVGASFTADKQLIEFAKKYANQLDKNKVSFSSCDD